MGLALCHTLPRDSITRGAALLAVVACLLQLIALADGGNNARLRWFTIEDTIPKLGATPWEVSNFDDRGKSTRSKMCPTPAGASATQSSLCDEYLREMETVVILSGISGGLTVVLSFIVGCVITRASQKNTRFLFAYAIAHLLPAGCAMAALIVMLERGAEALKGFLEVAAPSATVKYSHGANLILFAGLMYAAAATLSFAKVLWFCVESKHLKNDITKQAEARAEEMMASNEEVSVENATFSHDLKLDERVAIRVVNDDWTRQKAIWLERRMVVQKTLKQAGLTSKEERERFADKRLPRRDAARSGTFPRVDTSSSPTEVSKTAEPSQATMRDEKEA